MMYRLRNDFQLSIITLLGVFAAIGVTPFALYRFVKGDILAGTIDLLAVVGVIFSVFMAWRTGNTGRSGLFLAIVACVGAVVTAMVRGEVGLFWLYPSLFTSFLLTPPRVAVLVNLLSLAFLVGYGAAFTSMEQMLSFMTTVIVVNSCAFAFARRNEVQRLRLEQLATIDPLTGVKNRRSMDIALELALAMHDRNGSSYALVVLDLDGFKQVNDQFGHSVGDGVLVDCARLVQKRSRKVDQLFRFGGEEFVLLIAGAESHEVPWIVQNLQAELRQNLQAPCGPVTVSFGVSLVKSTDDANSWFNRADRAMYQAKLNGRDQIVYADTDTPMASSVERKTDACPTAGLLK